MNFACAEAPACIGVKAAQVGLGMKAPTFIGNAFYRAKETEAALLHSPLCAGHAMAAPYIHAGNGDLRDRVPVDRVTEGLV